MDYLQKSENAWAQVVTPWFLINFKVNTAQFQRI